MTPIKKLIDIYGTPTKAGLALGLSRQVIEQWVKRNYIPYTAATYVQTKTNGAIPNIKIWLAADRARHTINGE